MRGATRGSRRGVIFFCATRALFRRLEVFVLADVVRGADQNKSWMVSARHAQREAFSYHCSCFMFLAVFAIVYYSVDAGRRNFVPRLVGCHAVEFLRFRRR